MAGKFEGIVKLDLSATNGGAVAGRLSHGPNRWGGEAVFANAGGPPGGAQTCSLYSSATVTVINFVCDLRGFSFPLCCIFMRGLRVPVRSFHDMMFLAAETLTPS